MKKCVYIALGLLTLIVLSSCASMPIGVYRNDERVKQDFSNRTISVFPFFEGTILTDSLCADSDSFIQGEVLVSMRNTLEELHGEIKVQEEMLQFDYVPPNDTTSYKFKHMGREYATIVGINDEGNFLLCDWYLLPYEDQFKNLGYEPDIVLIPTWMTVYHIYETTTLVGMEIDKHTVAIAAELRFMLWDYREGVPLVWGETSVSAEKGDYETLGERLLINALIPSKTLISNLVHFNRPYNSSSDLLLDSRMFFH